MPRLDADKGKSIRLATVSWRLPDAGRGARHLSMRNNLEKAGAVLDEAGRRGADIVCLPELFATKMTRSQRQAQAVPGGKICAFLAGKARQWKMAVIGTLYEKAREKQYHAAAVFNAMGRYQGAFRKVHLPPEEEGIACGNRFPVFNLGGVRIGCMICLDIQPPESARCLALSGAQILFWPTMYSDAELALTLMKARAIENGVFLVCANYWQRRGPHIGHACVIDPGGRVLADTGEREGVVVQTIRLSQTESPRAGFPKALSIRQPSAYAKIAR